MTAPPSANVGRDWDAGAYDRVADPQEDWGREVSIDSLEGDEVLLDAGCGSGRVTELLLERLPHGCVIGVDASEAMVERARARLGRRAEVRTGDLAESSSSRLRSTQSSRTPSSTGYPTTSASSSGSTPPCDPAAGSPRSAARERRLGPQGGASCVRPAGLRRSPPPARRDLGTLPPPRVDARGDGSVVA